MPCETHNFSSDQTNCEEHREDVSYDFDLTPQINPLLNISTPNITINPALDEEQNTVEQNEVIQGGLESLASLRIKNYKNPCISYLNINSLRGNKFAQLDEILKSIQPDIICIDETKLTPDFLTTQFHIEEYHFPPFRRDRPQPTNATHFGGGKIVYTKGDLISNRINKFETEHAETICIDLTIKEIKWFILFAYRPESIDRKLFFDEITKSLSKATKDYNNIIVIGDLNIDLTSPLTDKFNLLSEFCATFNLKNLVKGKTCNKSKEGSSIDVILTNKPRSFFNTNITETGLSDHHCMISTFLRCHYEKLPPPKKFYLQGHKKYESKQFY